MTEEIGGGCNGDDCGVGGCAGGSNGLGGDDRNLGEKSRENLLCCGDNLLVMKSLLSHHDMAGKLQMVYIDPPFYSKANYDAVVRAGGESVKYAAYDDKWEEGLSSYLEMLTGRFYLIRELLSDTGLLWVHLDWHVVHYAKVILDEIFGEKNFVNEIIWNYKSGGTSKRHFSRKHDTILVYGKSRNYQFYPLQEKSYNRGFKPYRFKGVKEYQDERGWYTLVNMKDVWNIDMVGRTSKERTGYATQKPEQLIQRMIESCTREGDLCADFFCGSGTLPATAAKMGRRFVACDMGNLACESTALRLSAQKTEFSLWRLEDLYKPCGLREPKTGLEVEIGFSADPLFGTDTARVSLKLISLKEAALDGIVDEKNRKNIEKLLKEDALQLVESWSVDFDYKAEEGVHRPQEIFMRQQEKLALSCEGIVPKGAQISVKVTDVFGNTAFAQFTAEHR